MNRIVMEKTEGDFGFDVKDEKNHLLQTDSSEESGGTNYGFRPMQLLLSALGTCSAIDMIAILKKQKQTIRQFKITVEGEREEGKIPSLWKAIKISFIIQGVDKDKAEKAAFLSMDKYCSVAETLRRGGTEITYEINVID
ncbi:MAG TPA: OsmC family protein [Chitinophagaceae bacterium]|nr:OsmC family protein [Chitinophagaceae bacterium]